jgi:tape measure domain-containing protein
VAVSNVELIVSAAKAVNPLKRVQKETLTVEQRLKKTNEETRKVAQAFQFMGNRAKRALRDAESGAAQLGERMRTVRTAVKAASVAFAAYKAIQVGISRVESERRLKLLARGYGEVAELQAAAGLAASKFNISQTEANQGISNAYARLRPLGVTLEDITSTFGGFRAAAVLGGATAQEAAASFTQLSQALGSGALRGDEFRSVSEQAPLVLQAISDETGIAAGKLKEYAAEGLITSDIVIKALKRIEAEGADKLTEALGGPAAAIKNFQNAAEDVAAAATETIIPQMSTAFEDLAEIIRDLEGPIKFIGGLIGGLLEGIATVTTRLRRGGAAVAQAEMRATDATRRQLPGIGANDPKFLALYQKELERRLARIDGQVYGQLPPSAAFLPGDSNKKGTTPLSLPGPKDKSRRTARRTARTTKARVDATKELLALQEKLTFSIDTISERERLILEHKIAQQKITEQNLLPNEKKIAFLQAEQSHMESILSLEKRLANEQEQRAKETRDAFDKAMKDEADKAQKLKEADPGFQMQKQFGELIKLENQVAAGATAIGDAFSNAFVGVISGAKSAQEGLAEMMQSVAKHFLDMATKIIAEQIAMILYGTIMKALGVSMPGGSSPGIQQALAVTPQTGAAATSTLNNFLLPRANGGPVSANTPYIVGERGPELMIPSTSGMVLSNSETRQQLTEQGSAMRSTEATRQQLNTQRNTMITNSTRETERMTEMMLSNPDPIDVRYESTVINSVEYVTAEQHRQGMAQAAERGRSLTLSALQGSVKTRKKVGLS